MKIDQSQFNIKKMSRYFFISAVLWMLVTGGQARSYIPSYIKPCSKGAADFVQCCIKHGNEALPFLVKGDKKFGIPVLQPLFLPTIQIDAGKELQIKLSDVNIFGLDKMHVEDLKIDFKAMKFDLKLSCERIEIIGKYKVNGKILVLPIEGNGPINITADGGTFNYGFNFNLEKKKGIEYGAIEKDHISFELKKAYFKLDNLFNGDEKLGSNLNTFLNENWKDVVKELGGAIEGTIAAVAKKIAQNVFGRIPYAELFAP